MYSMCTVVLTRVMVEWATLFASLWAQNRENEQHSLITPGRGTLVGIPSYHPEEVPWWVFNTTFTRKRHPGGYSPLFTPGRGTLVGIRPLFTPQEALWWVYTTILASQRGSGGGLYPILASQGGSEGGLYPYSSLPEGS